MPRRFCVVLILLGVEMANRKVPFAILCCFLIAFILQGILKLCGVFVFEKALDWEIFEIIDNSMWLSIIYYSIIIFIAMYCLSFTLSVRPYSKCWYHYVILVVFAFGITTLKYLTGNASTTTGTARIDILYDIILYIFVPLLIYFTTPKRYRLFENMSLRNVVLIIAFQIMLYFIYLGLNYWSVILTSVIPSTQYIVYSASMLLIQLEVYIGLVAIMLSANICLNIFVKEYNMLKPVNIASDEAKKKEIERIKAEKASKKSNKDDK